MAAQQPPQTNQPEDASPQPAEAETRPSESQKPGETAASVSYPLPENLGSMDQGSFFATYAGTFTSPENFSYQCVVTPGPGECFDIPDTIEEL